MFTSSRLDIVRLSCFIIFTSASVLGLRVALGDDQLIPFSALKSQFSGLTSIDVEGTYSCRYYDASIINPTENPFERVKVHFREQADRYWFEVTEIHGTHKVLPASMIWAFNGTNAQYWDEQGLLSIKKGPLENSTFAAILFHPLSSYIPFYPLDRTKDGGYLPRLTDFSNPTMFQKSVGQFLPATKIDWSQKDLISYECNAEGEGVGLEKTILKFGLDPLHGYAPVVWERWQGDKRVVTSEVLELGEFHTPGGSKFYFPRKTKFCWLKPDGKSVLSEIDFELSSLVLGKSYTDDEFTIDPGTANLIFDVDAKKVIQVPQ